MRQQPEFAYHLWAADLPDCWWSLIRFGTLQSLVASGTRKATL
jgi:hypothetical protein